VTALLCAAASCVGIFVVLPALQDGDVPSDVLTITPAGGSSVEATATDPPPAWVGDATDTSEPATATPLAPTATFTPRPVTGGSGSGEGGSDGEIQVVVENRSYYDFCYVYISPTDSDAWGENRLNTDEVIAPDASWSFMVPDGVYDFLVRDCLDEAIIYTSWDFSGSQTFQIGDWDLVPIQIINEVATDICYVYISPPTSDSWGEDWLADNEVIPPNEARVFFVEPGMYDMLARDCDENVLGEIYDYDAVLEYWFVDGMESEF
jgi:hypothetical protein